MKPLKFVMVCMLAGLLVSSCSVFRKKEKLNCPNDYRGKSEEEIMQLQEKQSKKKSRVQSKF